MPSTSAPVKLCMLPSTKNSRFYGRTTELSKLHTLLAPVPEPIKEGLRSTAIYGLGGVGKSQIALMYAQQHAEDYDAIFWIHSQTLASLEQSVAKAIDLLNLGTETGGEAGTNNTQNRIIFLIWLQNTGRIIPRSI